MQPHIAPNQAAAHAPASGHAEGQQHPIKLYLVVWGWLFVLSTFSYLVDYFPPARSTCAGGLILLFMMLKAGLIVAFFMHMKWERLTLIYAMLLPPCRGAGVRRHQAVGVGLHAPDPDDVPGRAVG